MRISDNQELPVIDLSNMVIILKKDYLLQNFNYNLNNTLLTGAPKAWRMWLIMKLLCWHPIWTLEQRVKNTKSNIKGENK